MLDAIRYNLTHVLDFNGRDARQTFWYYVLFIVLAQFAVGIVMSIPMYISMVTSGIEAAQASANGTAGDDAMLMDGMFEGMFEQLRTQMVVSTVIGVIVTFLMAAAFVRRLHDSGFPGWIVAIPIVANLVGLGFNYTFFDRMEEIMRETMVVTDGAPAMDPFAVQAEMGLMGLVGWIAIIVVIGFGILQSEDGPNQYGDAPVRF